MSPDQEVSSSYLEKLQAGRLGLKSESERLGRDQADRLSQVFHKMLASPTFEGRGIILHESTLLRASVAFWEDMLRIKAYHPIDRTDRYKKAGYIFKWIIKMRPVKPDEENPENLRSQDLNANAMFAVLCACGYLNIGLIPEQEFNRIVYTATYREINPDEWAMQFRLMEKLYSRKRAAKK